MIYVEQPKPGKHPKLIVDNNFFRRHSTRATKSGITIRWRCIDVPKTKCKAVIYTTLQEGTVIKSLYQHNHEDNATKRDKQDMIEKEFAIFRSTRECKRGPVRNPLKSRRKSKCTAKSEQGEDYSGKNVLLHIDGQTETLLFQVEEEKEEIELENKSS